MNFKILCYNKNTLIFENKERRIEICVIENYYYLLVR